MIPQPPFLLVSRDDHSVDVFPDAETLCRHAEPIDVFNREYDLYESTGRLVALTVERRPTRRLFGLIRGVADTVVVGRAEQHPSHSQALADTLERALSGPSVSHRDSLVAILTRLRDPGSSEAV